MIGFRSVDVAHLGMQKVSNRVIDGTAVYNEWRIGQILVKEPLSGFIISEQLLPGI